MSVVEFRGGDLRKHMERKSKEEIIQEYMDLLRLWKQATPGRRTMEAELAVDVYCGENCDEHQPYWRASAEGDRDGPGEIPNPLELDMATFSPGTRVFVFEPECPRCGQVRVTCEQDEGCDFDWRKRDEERYA